MLDADMIDRARNGIFVIAIHIPIVVCRFTFFGRILSVRSPVKVSQADDHLPRLGSNGERGERARMKEQQAFLSIVFFPV